MVNNESWMRSEKCYGMNRKCCMKSEECYETNGEWWIMNREWEAKSVVEWIENIAWKAKNVVEQVIMGGFWFHSPVSNNNTLSSKDSTVSISSFRKIGCLQFLANPYLIKFKSHLTVLPALHSPSPPVCSAHSGISSGDVILPKSQTQVLSHQICPFWRRNVTDSRVMAWHDMSMAKKGFYLWDWQVVGFLWICDQDLWSVRFGDWEFLSNLDSSTSSWDSRVNLNENSTNDCRCERHHWIFSDVGFPFNDKRSFFHQKVRSGKQPFNWRL
jgi:hypothetical protein